ncbi:MAG: SLC13 family permease [candidate division Zixibacteria bacterium]|nr:SLC13 family permease [candidate division Zixibacteria bacterium]
MSTSRKQKLGLFLGPLAALLLCLFADLQPGEPVVTLTAAVVLLMAIWWITEAIPIPATALLPVALFPLLGIMKGKTVAALYFNNIIFLFIGGFIMALAMEKWGLHRRIALRVILLIGASPRRIILGFMVATFFLSMWISNTATTMMMVPIALAIIFKLKEMYEGPDVARFSVGLLIGIAYAASIGGTATLIGTPPNLSFARIFQIYFPQAPEISFAAWFAFALPMALLFLIIAWLVLTHLSVSRNLGMGATRQVFKDEQARLGRISYEETVVLIGFCLMALLWLFRRDITIGSFVFPGWTGLMPEPGMIDDGTIAIAIAALLFVIPARIKEGGRLMNWKTASKLNWGIVLLFGGGFALASGFKESGLSLWIGDALAGLEQFPTPLIVGAICTSITFLTELTSNTATTEIILPILGSLSVAMNVNPLLLMIPATLSASCAFMLPVATPPNAIVFGTGQIRMADMIRCGIILNLVGIVLITTYMFIVGMIAFDISLAEMPGWAITP